MICACSAFVPMAFHNNYTLKLTYATAVEHSSVDTRLSAVRVNVESRKQTNQCQ